MTTNHVMDGNICLSNQSSTQTLQVQFHLGPEQLFRVWTQRYVERCLSQIVSVIQMNTDMAEKLK